MAKETGIEWCDHSFNGWWGCVRVSPACRWCYAETWAKRRGYDVWGPRAPRRFFGDAHWAEPLGWNRQAARTGVRRRVFCASMGDVFEDRRDLDVHRERLWDLIGRTPNLDWLLLTKRIEHVSRLSPWSRGWPPNVWLGTTTENQETFDFRAPLLAAVPAVVRFLSCEPLMGPVRMGDTGRWIDWVIAGGETGPAARSTSPSWFLSLRDECQSAGVAFFFKQWGDWGPSSPDFGPRPATVVAEDGTHMARVGKKRTGRLLDGSEFGDFPVPRWYSADPEELALDLGAFELEVPEAATC